ncbi:MAG: DUF2334 domain-containing protein [Lachnospiraceae bacterium]|nr:DUF2334 domain-containing protein [Lachnospiraceae bacterium]
MKIAVRMDDITCDMDWKSFYSMKAILDEAEIRPLIGVVPDNQDPLLQCEQGREDFWDYIIELQNQGWSVAMHGYRHLYETKHGGMFPLNHFSEFAGLSYEEQSEKIRQGKEIFLSHGIHTDIFMAPGHSYDKNTLKALKEHGFHYITDGFGYRPYRYLGMTFLPIAFHSIRSIQKKNKEMTTLVYHLNHTKQVQFEQIRNLLQNQAYQFVSYSDILKLEPKERKLPGYLLERIKAEMKHDLMKLKNFIRRR